MRIPGGLGVVFVGLAVAAGWPARSWGQGARGPELKVDLLDVGQGDAVLIRSPEGKVALIDAGPNGGVVDLLKRKRVATIDLLVLTHHHVDHYGGMADVIREFRPRVFLATESATAPKSYAKLLEVVQASGVRAIRPGATARKIGLGSAVLTVLPRPAEDAADEDDNSIGLRLDYGGFSALLTGDALARSRGAWLKSCPELVRDCTVLKLGQHGGRDGVDARWLDAVRPELTVASLGAGNEEGDPHPDTLSLLARRKLPLLRTDRAGTLSIVSDGTTWDVLTARLGRPGDLAAVSDAPRDEAVRAASTTLDLNKATVDQLAALPGVGTLTARRIVSGRPYGSVDELVRVRGIGGPALEGLRPLVDVR